MGLVKREFLAIGLIVLLAAFIVLVGAGIIPTQNPYYQPPTHYNPNLIYPTGNVILNATEYNPQFVEPVDGIVYTACKLTSYGSNEIFDWVREHNITIEGATGGGSYCIMSQSTLESLRETNFSDYIAYIQDVPVEAKVSQDLLEEAVANPNKEFHVVVQFFDGVPETTTTQVISEYSTHVFWGPEDNDYLINSTGENVVRLSSTPSVRRIGEQYTGPATANLNGVPAVGGDLLLPQLDGSGVVIEISDTGAAYNGTHYHPDLPTPADSHNFCTTGSNTNPDNFTDGSGHGTHATGIALGRGNNESGYRGVAEGASLITYKMMGNNNLLCDASVSKVLESAAGNGTHISSNSWGTEETYGENAEYVDSAVLGDYTDSAGNPAYMTVIVAAGNDNSTILSPGVCKNCITVGAAKIGNYENEYSVYVGGDFVCMELNEPAAFPTCYSNYGPVGDRVKPDIIAPGSTIVSAYPWYLDGCALVDSVGNPYYCRATGTSAATPYVSGIAALMMEANSTLISSPEAVKARLINSAVYLDGLNGIDLNKQGHGHVNGFNAIEDTPGVFETVLQVNDTVSNLGDSKNYTFNVPAGYKEVKVTLVYSDDEGNSGNLYHNLYLQVFDGGGALLAGDYREDPVKNVTWDSSATAGTWKARVLYNSSGGASVRTVRYAVVASARLADSALSLSVPSNPMTIGANQTVIIKTNLTNNGFTTVGSYVELKPPSGSSFYNVTVYRNDGINFTLNTSWLYYNTTSGYYHLSLGEVVKGYARYAEWILKAPENASGTTNIPIRYGAMNFDVANTSVDVVVGALQLKQGWNLVAFPNLPSNKSVESVLSPLSGKYTKLQTYDGTRWYSYDIRVPQRFNTLTQLEFGKAYRVLMTQDAPLPLVGERPASVVVHLKQGWNYIGYPYDARSLTLALADIAGKYTKVQSFVNGTWYSYDIRVPSSFNTLENMTTGEGYKILITTDTDVTLS